MVDVEGDAQMLLLGNEDIVQAAMPSGGVAASAQSESSFGVPQLEDNHTAET